MYRVNRHEGSVELGTLFKDTAEGVGRLMADHVRLARLELLADVKTLGRRAAMLAGVVGFVFLGYVFCCLGVAVVVSRWMGLGGGLFLLGGMHLIGGVTALFFAMRRLRGMHLMREAAREVGQSVSTLTTSVVKGAVSTAAARECTASGERAIKARTEGESHIADPRQ